MKKSLLTLGVACMCLSSFGFTRVLYQQNFEGAQTPEEAGWTYGSAASIASDGEGKFLELNNNGANGRSGQTIWGSSIYLYEDGTPILEDGKYTMTFEFKFNAFSNNQYDGCIDVFTNHEPKVANQAYRMPWTNNGDGGVWENFILDLTQMAGSADTFYVNAPTKTTETTNEETGEVTVTYSVAEENPFTFNSSDWYLVTLTVDTEARTVDYLIENMSNQDDAISGTREVPAVDPDGSDVSMFAEGMYIKTARYTADMFIDNISITCETKNAFAGKPTVALTRIGWTGDEDNQVENLAARGYKVSFGLQETLHFVGVDGVEKEYEWDDCDGSLEYETMTSGTIKAWTTCEDATSEVVEMTVDCNPIALPAAQAIITSVTAGFGKMYALTVSNSEVPLRPNIVMNYSFAGNEGEALEGSGLYSGDKITVTQGGTLTVTTKAFGYQSTTVNIANNKEFAAKTVYDFARLSDDELKNIGFTSWATTNSSSTSGFNNWTARKRLFYYDSASEYVDEETGETKWNAVYPFGFIAEDNTTNVIESSVIAAADCDHSALFENLVFFPDERNVGYIKHLGMYNDETANNYNDVTIKGVEASDFILVNTIGAYGQNSCHPVVASDAEYYAVLAGDDAVLNAAELLQLDPANLPNLKREGISYSLLNEETGKYDIHFALYRIDTVLTKLSIFSQVGGPVDDAVDAINAVEGDGYWYSIDGVRVAEPTRPGLYIHNGKKYILK